MGAKACNIWTVAVVHIRWGFNQTREISGGGREQEKGWCRGAEEVDGMGDGKKG